MHSFEGTNCEKIIILYSLCSLWLNVDKSRFFSAANGSCIQDGFTCVVLGNSVKINFTS